MTVINRVTRERTIAAGKELALIHGAYLTSKEAMLWYIERTDALFDANWGAAHCTLVGLNDLGDIATASAEAVEEVL